MQPNSMVMSFFSSGFQLTTAFMLYSLLHSMPSLYSVMMPQDIAYTINNLIRFTTCNSIPSIPITSTGVSIPVLPTSTVPSGTVQPQPLLGAPLTEAFNMRQVITNVVSNQVKTKRRMLQAIGHPTTYENLLEETEQSSFTQAIIDTNLPAKFQTPTLSKFDGTHCTYKSTRPSIDPTNHTIT
ncbi:hypothetical protein TIFTF001_029519 [Ficus carica]|uniref:Uncharacterized protein n=1 Tax=Ficus carica TaxID=3494 RepID=A0AA88DW46_FICCA|nr:hypothetical protein TIFTF001_029519 [Ficus carica]